MARVSGSLGSKLLLSLFQLGQERGGGAELRRGGLRRGPQQAAAPTAGESNTAKKIGKTGKKRHEKENQIITKTKSHKKSSKTCKFPLGFLDLEWQTVSSAVNDSICKSVTE